MVQSECAHSCEHGENPLRRRAKVCRTSRCPTNQLTKQGKYSKCKRSPKCMSNIWRTGRRSSSFPCSCSFMELFTRSCMWATVHLNKNEDQHQRVSQNVEMDKVVVIFKTRPNRPIGLEALGERIHYSNSQFPSSYNQKCVFSAILCCGSSDNVNRIPNRERCGKGSELRISSQLQSTASSAQDTQRFNFSP